jgi:hypothetical protein
MRTSEATSDATVRATAEGRTAPPFTPPGLDDGDLRQRARGSAEGLSLEAMALLKRLDAQIDAVVLSRQHPLTGLLPASTANTVHGNYGDAWVRDCVYSIQCVWGLAMAHRRQSGPCRRAFELERRVLLLMRGSWPP